MHSPVAEFAAVSKTYRAPLRPGRTVQALQEVSFAIEPGEVFALLGPNRAGKTTLVKVLLGLCHPSGGRVFRLGRPGAERSTLARVGYMHENQAFPHYLTAAALLEFYGHLSWVPALDPENAGARAARKAGAGGPCPRADCPLQQGHGPRRLALGPAHAWLSRICSAWTSRWPGSI